MNHAQQKHYQSLYKQHVNALICQGKAEATIDVYSRAVRRITESFDLCPDTLTQDHLETYFTALIKTHPWSMVKTDRNGLHFFYKYILQQQWQWVDIVKPPIKKILPDALIPQQVEFIINSTRELRYRLTFSPLTAWGCAWAKPLICTSMILTEKP